MTSLHFSICFFLPPFASSQRCDRSPVPSSPHDTEGHLFADHPSLSFPPLPPTDGTRYPSKRSIFSRCVIFHPWKRLYR
ncbi:uncharacterized protein BJ171DRAFT_204299 [Polychytrium aggregatum]|uniref:uncharacterized protein n=1 Tax=Polychytrium aggregatum TaxID=110093 RepID=UPI0022FEBBD9|nr:uncharacterized protein BJ171DRAFT_204299 [Polychytrium aggregatum]KAI9199568.1 hypothetical protein BJ171DRAFT_204299 [Polychytrium aggregatum]